MPELLGKDVLKVVIQCGRLLRQLKRCIDVEKFVFPAHAGVYNVVWRCILSSDVKSTFSRRWKNVATCFNYFFKLSVLETKPFQLNRADYKVFENIDNCAINLS